MTRAEGVTINEVTPNRRISKAIRRSVDTLATALAEECADSNPGLTPREWRVSALHAMSSVAVGTALDLMEHPDFNAALREGLKPRLAIALRVLTDMKTAVTAQEVVPDEQ